MEETPAKDKKGELTIAVNIGPISITVRGDDWEELEKLLKNGLDLAAQYQKRIQEIVARVSLESPNDSPLNKAQRSPAAETTIKSDPSDIGISNIVRAFADGSIKFVAKKVFELKTYEVIALAMYALNKPLGPAEIASNISKAWKSVSADSVSVYFRRELKANVTNNEGKYTLNGAGKNWVEQELMKKCPE